MRTFILGNRSYLSNNLKKIISNTYIYSIKDFINLNIRGKYNLIINSFYPSKKLNNINKFEEFTKYSLGEISLLLDKLNPKDINKIIYTSTSAINGLDIKNTTSISRNLYSSFKFAAEHLLKKFCDRAKNIDLINARVYNIYGLEEDFSIISKLKNKNINLKIYNNGNSIRDYIHISDVCKIYNRILQKKITGIIEIGTGRGISLREIINKTNSKRKIKILKKKIIEINCSIANTDNIKNKLNFNKFKKLENFFFTNSQKTFNSFSYDQLKKDKNIVIYGAGYSGKKIFNKLRENNNNVLFFVDDDVSKIGNTINGVQIISFDQLKSISQIRMFEEIILAIPSLNNKRQLDLTEKLILLARNVRKLPEKKFLLNKDINLESLQFVDHENILNRSFYDLSEKSLKKYDKANVLITGGAGSIGSEITQQLLKSNINKIIVYDNSEYNVFLLSQNYQSPKISFILGDINDGKFLEKILLDNDINYLFHCAAYKHVKFLEDNLLSAVKNNIFGTLTVLNCVKKLKINSVFVSTDKAVKPENYLGMTKRIAELILLKNNKNEKQFNKTPVNIVRFGNVIGSTGSAIPIFIKQIINDRPITLTHKKMKRYFMSLKEACNLVLEVSHLKNPNNGIFILKMGKQLKIYNIIKRLFELYKKKGQKFNLKIIGNNKNEKLSEKLSYSNQTYNTSIDKIFLVYDPIPNNILFKEFLKNLNLFTFSNNEKETRRLLISFFKKQI